MDTAHKVFHKLFSVLIEWVAARMVLAARLRAVPFASLPLPTLSLLCITRVRWCWIAVHRNREPRAMCWGYSLG